MERYICIHGHFYQPPRENPSLEAIELQDSAYPYHDWNERITAECYEPNAASRILDGDGRINKIVNNYANMSFNFGPTLLAWMEEKKPEVYRAVLEADLASQTSFSGHGSAMAQAYSHMIMPLATHRDKYTQVAWGIRDFEHRFGRVPEGMWLPETAVDLETLEVLAEFGIQFTVLSPYQASRVRALEDEDEDDGEGEDEDDWEDVEGGKIDPTRSYLINLPSGRRINLFFYDGPISRGIAFENVLDRGEDFANRLTGAFSEDRDWPQLVNVATDGETYGHHHRHGEMALSYATDYIASNALARLTNYGEYLEKCPPTHEVQLFENTSWSCVHGIERWRSDCGCNSGGHGDWNQAWRGPLRDALNWLRDTLAPRYEQAAQDLLKDPWLARNDYINVILDRSPESLERFFSWHAARELSGSDRVRALKLLEMQRHCMLMYTSCGWFFDELSGIETVQVIQYAGRAVQLAMELFADDVEESFLERLAQAKANIPEHGDGRAIYDKWVKPALIDLDKVSAHYAISSLFESYGDQTRIYCYTVDREDYRILPAGRLRLAVGRATTVSEITHEKSHQLFSVLDLGGHNVSGYVREYRGEEEYGMLVQELSSAFTTGDLPDVIRAMDKNFGTYTYSLRQLFKDEQRKILSVILGSTLAETEAIYRQVYDNHAPMMRFLSELGVPQPKGLHAAADLALSTSLRRALDTDDLDPAFIRGTLHEASASGASLDGAELGYAMKGTLDRLLEQLKAEPSELALLQRAEEAATIVGELPFEVNIWQAQNRYYEMLQTVYPRTLSLAETGDEDARLWVERFASLGEKLWVRVDEVRLREKGGIPIRAATAPRVLAQEVVAQRRIPGATYRLQFNHGFTFHAASSIVSYLEELGITDFYASPLLRARQDSEHGYDICDHGMLNPAIGSAEEFEQLSSELRSRGMGLIMDMVPNHMGIGEPCNSWWMDVLENGPSSLFASYFDIHWHPLRSELEGKVLLPVLEDQYGKVLETGKLQLSFEEGAFYVYYYDTRLPLAPKSYASILEHGIDRLVQLLGENDVELQELQSILTAINYLPSRTELEWAKRVERNREKEVIKRRLAALCEASPEISAHILASVEELNGNEDDPESFGELHRLLENQAFRPAFWRVAAEEINYRRFFDVNDLAAIRVELPEVFEATHRLILRMLAEERLTGLRIDHPDGLWDPRGYFLKLQEAYVLHTVRARLASRQAVVAEPPVAALGVAPLEGDGGGSQAAAEARSAGRVTIGGGDGRSAPADEGLEVAVAEWFADEYGRKDGRTAPWPLYVVAEKILSEGEPLPPDWAVYGTTGYDFLNSLNGLFVDSSSRSSFDRIYGHFTGADLNFQRLTNSSKKMIMLVSLVSEINALGHQMDEIAKSNRLYRDFTLNNLTFAMREIIACLPVYRTYTDASGHVTHTDQQYVDAAVDEAKRRNPRTAPYVFDFIRDTLLLRNLGQFSEEARAELIDFVMRFQQVTGPVMAKAVEDTAFYVYNRLVSLNEVGGHPSQFGLPLSAFHRQNSERQRQWPHSMLASTTHDTKRSEDVRARIDVLSELPEEWKSALARWSRQAARKKAEADGEPAPDRNDEYLLYQTLLGSWPAEYDGRMLPAEQMADYRERIVAYMQKATKEAKVHTSWINPNQSYDQAVESFVRGLLEDGGNLFLEEFLPFQRQLSFFGRFNSLSQQLLKLTSPGVPDIYQGTEMWALSLVDPDNRRPVDYAQRMQALAEVKSRLRGKVDGREDPARGLAAELLSSAKDGRIKLYVTYRTLNYRRDYQQLFASGSYLGLDTGGQQGEHVCAYARALGQDRVIVAVPRLVARLMGGKELLPLGERVWGDSWIALPPEVSVDSGRRVFRNLFTGESILPIEQDGSWLLPVSSVFSSFPVALLTMEEWTGSDKQGKKDR